MMMMMVMTMNDFSGMIMYLVMMMIKMMIDVIDYAHRRKRLFYNSLYHANPFYLTLQLSVLRM
jgi:hypothetical protein